MSNAASEAAAGLVPEIATELVASSAPSELAGSSLVEEIHAAAAEPSVPSSQPAPVATEVAEDGDESVFELPTFSYIETEDDDEDDELLPAATVEEDDELAVDEYEDESQLRARLAKAEKQAKHYAEQAAQAKQGQWRKKYKEMYPLANVDSITATSRRGFEKAAVKSHNDNYKLLEPTLRQLKETAEKLTSSVTAEARTAAAAAFGKPVAGPGIVPLESSKQTEDLIEARKTGDLSRVLSVLMRR